MSSPVTTAGVFFVAKNKMAAADSANNAAALNIKIKSLLFFFFLGMVKK